jgi:hypothetical protein
VTRERTGFAFTKHKASTILEKNCKQLHIKDQLSTNWLLVSQPGWDLFMNYKIKKNRKMELETLLPQSRLPELPIPTTNLVAVFA